MTDPLRRLATLLSLEVTIRKARTTRELALVMVNETAQVVPQRQAVLLAREGSHWRILLFAGVPRQEQSTPFGIWLEKALHAWPGQATDQPQVLTPSDLPPDLAQSWSAWLPAQGLWLPVRPDREPPMALLLARETPFDPAELHLLTHLVQAYGYAWEKLAAPHPWTRFRLSGRLKPWVLALLATGLLLMPVRLSVLATASVMPSEPLVVSAPLEGVIRTFHVQPNQVVRQDQPLFSLDSMAMESRREMAVKALAAEKADFMRATRKGFVDDASKSEAAYLEARMAIKAAELAFIEEQLAQITVRAGQDGIAVFNDVNDWLGKPVRQGERILYLADPAKTEIEGWISVNDAIRLENGASVTLFLDTQPLDPLTAVLVQQAYEARESPEKVLGFSFRARFQQTPGPRIGLKGAAKIQGEQVSLLYYLLRRPVGALRRTVGL